jgi:hypothetical protein
MQCLLLKNMGIHTSWYAYMRAAHTDTLYTLYLLSPGSTGESPKEILLTFIFTGDLSPHQELRIVAGDNWRLRIGGKF